MLPYVLFLELLTSEDKAPLSSQFTPTEGAHKKNFGNAIWLNASFVCLAILYAVWKQRNFSVKVSTLSLKSAPGTW